MWRPYAPTWRQGTGEGEGESTQKRIVPSDFLTRTTGAADTEGAMTSFASLSFTCVSISSLLAGIV